MTVGRTKQTICSKCGNVVREWKNPVPTVDIIIMIGKKIVLIERENEPFGWALPGGYVDYGESLETAAIREAKEETGLDIKNLKQFCAYSDPDRDSRQHNISMVFTAEATGEPIGGDDAKTASVYTLDDLPDLVFDHNKIVDDYIRSRLL